MSPVHRGSPMQKRHKKSSVRSLYGYACIEEDENENWLNIEWEADDSDKDNFHSNVSAEIENEGDISSFSPSFFQHSLNNDNSKQELDEISPEAADSSLSSLFLQIHIA